jgi:hypothetical protein
MPGTGLGYISSGISEYTKEYKYANYKQNNGFKTQDS